MSFALMWSPSTFLRSPGRGGIVLCLIRQQDRRADCAYDSLLGSVIGLLLMEEYNLPIQWPKVAHYNRSSFCELEAIRHESSAIVTETINSPRERRADFASNSILG